VLQPRRQVSPSSSQHHAFQAATCYPVLIGGPLFQLPARDQTRIMKRGHESGTADLTTRGSRIRAVEESRPKLKASH